MAMQPAAWLIRSAAWLVPGDERAEWRREWLAELASQTRARRRLAFALGAPVHALALRGAGWRPAHVLADLAFGARWLWRRPLFAVAATVTLGLGIGATTATFSVVYGVLLQPLPYRDPSRLVQLWETNPLFNWTEAAIAPGNVISWRERNHVFSDIAWYAGAAGRTAGTAAVTLEGDNPTRVNALQVSANFFDVLGASARLGRTFAPGEDVPGHHRVMILSDAFWRGQMAADPGVLGRDVHLNGVTLKVIGVMPPGFQFDRTPTDFWIPLAMDVARQREVRRPHWMRAIARLKPGISVAAANADLTAIARELEREHPDTNTQMSVGAGALDDWFVGETRRPLWLFFLAVALVLLIACVNVANLLLLRTSERVREISVRAALGASRARLVRQLLTESLVIAAAGTALGVGLASLGIRLFVRLAPAGLPRLHEIGLHPAVLIFAVALTVLTTMVVGLAPAFHGARANLRLGLGDGGRTTSPQMWRMRRALVAIEVALAVVLLIGALMTARSFRALTATNPGFPADHLLIAKLSLPGLRYGDGKYALFFETVVSRLRGVPGVTAAGATTGLPLEGSVWTGDLFIDGRSDVHGRELRHKSITSGYLEALGLRLLAGRTIAATDRADAPPVVVINDACARQFFPGQNPIGKRVSFDDPSPKRVWNTIVGVVGNEPQDRLGQPAVPEVYQSNYQEESNVMALAVRSTLPTEQVVASVRAIVRDLDAQLALYGVGPMTDRLGASVARERVAAALIGVFGLCALVLAAIGVYGVAAYGVSSRTREIGIRVAFGATHANVLGLVVRQEMTGVVAGLAAGAAIAFAGSRVLDAVLFGAAGHDLVSYGGGMFVLLVAGFTACVIPARRAIRIEPVTALRVD